MFRLYDVRSIHVNVLLLAVDDCKILVGKILVVESFYFFPINGYNDIAWFHPQQLSAGGVGGRGGGLFFGAIPKKGDCTIMHKSKICTEHIL